VTVEMGKPEFKAWALNHCVCGKDELHFHVLCVWGAAYKSHGPQGPGGRFKLKSLRVGTAE